MDPSRCATGGWSGEGCWGGNNGGGFGGDDGYSGISDGDCFSAGASSPCGGFPIGGIGISIQISGGDLSSGTSPIAAPPPTSILGAVSTAPAASNPPSLSPGASQFTDGPANGTTNVVLWPLGGFDIYSVYQFFHGHPLLPFPFWERPFMRYCGPGTGTGSGINQVDDLCHAHDDCYAAAKATYRDNIPIPGFPVSPTTRAALNACNKSFCSALLSMKPKNSREASDASAVGSVFSCKP